MASPAAIAGDRAGDREGEAPGAPERPGLARGAPCLAALAALTAHVSTLAPTIGFGDSPELSAAALSLGVPHPTGYPLLMLIGHGFSRIVAFGDPAWRLNLLCALLTAGAVGLSAAFVQRLTGRAVAGWVAGLAVAFSPAVWANANLFEVYALHLLFVAGLLLLWLRYEQAPTAPRLRALVFVAGLSVTHHLMIGLVLPILAASVLRHVRRFAHPGELVRLSLAFLLPLGVLAYLPLAALANPVVDWGDPSTPMRFWAHVTARQYHVNVGGDAGLPFWRPAFEYLHEALSGFTPVPLGLAGIGAAALLFGAATGAAGGDGRGRVWRPAGFVLVPVFVVGFAFGAFYDVVDREPFFLNATLALALSTGVGAAVVLGWLEARRPTWRAGATGALALLPALPLAIHHGALDRSADYRAHDHAVGILQTLPPDALLLVQGFEGYPPVYASLMEGVRPDVLVVDHYLRIRGDGGGYGPELERLRRTPGLDPRRLLLDVTAVAASLGRPLFLVPGVPDERWSEIGLVRVRRGLVDQLVPAAAGRLPAGDPPERPLAAFRNGPVLRSAALRRPRVEAGDPLPISLEWAWPAGASSMPLTVVIVAADAEGRMLEDDDGRPLLVHEHPLGQGIESPEGAPQGPWLESVALLMGRVLPPGPTSLFVALERDEGLQPTLDDRVFVRLGEVEVVPRQRAAWVPADPTADAATGRARLAGHTGVR